VLIEYQFRIVKRNSNRNAVTKFHYCSAGLAERTHLESLTFALKLSKSYDGEEEKEIHENIKKIAGLL
jgi:hypothetical protein